MTGTRSCRPCWLLLAIVMALGALIGYRLLVGTPTQQASDGRAQIQLEPADRDLVLAEMRMFLRSVQGITLALTEEDLAQVAEQARRMGLAAAAQVPASLMQALPLEFKTLGRSVHADFDQLALDAEQLGDREHSLRQLGDILGKCVACHATYRLTPAVPGH